MQRKTARKFRLGILFLLLFSGIISCTTQEIIEKVGQVDLEKPVASFVFPQNGAVISSDQIELSAFATDNKAMAFVEFLIEGQGREDKGICMGPFYKYSWNAAGWPRGTYTLAVKATDSAGNTALETISVTLKTASGINLTLPSGNSFGEVSGTISLAAQVAGEADEVRFYADQNQIGQTSVAPYAINFDTTTLTDKTYIITAKSFLDGVETAVSEGASLKIKNTAGAPSVEITDPLAGAILKGNVNLVADTSSDAVEVKFYLGTTLLGSGTKNQNQYSLSFNTVNVTDGAYTIKAVAKNAANLEGTDSIALSVHNTVSAISIKDTLSSPVSETVNIETTVSFDIQRVEFFVGTVSIGEVNAAPFTLSWNSRSVANGSYVLKAVGYPPVGNPLEALKNIQVENSSLHDDPVVDFTSLTNNQVVSANSFAVSGTASDGEGLAKLEIFVDGELKQTRNVSGEQANFTFDMEVSQSVSAANYQTFSSPAAVNFKEITSFGTNPGKLKFYLDVPQDMKENAPLVVVLHGCQQSADHFRRDTQWNLLAEKYKFYVVWPEQQLEDKTARTGNPYKCFNWGGYYGENKARGKGENQSVISMVNYVKANYSVNNQRVFVTGLSAGGAATNLLLATWPDVFAGGAPMAGIAYNCAHDVSESNVQAGADCMGVDINTFQPLTGAHCESGEACMNPNRKVSAAQWGNWVREAHPGYSGPYPRVIAWQGLSDQYVDDDNALEIVKQWTNVHGIDQTADNNGAKLKAGNTKHNYFEYKNTQGQSLVAMVEFPGMKHGIGIDPGTGEDQGGEAFSSAMGLIKFAFDMDLYSAYYTAKWWGLMDDMDQRPVVSITSPSEGAANLTTLTIQASMSDDKALSKVELLIDGVSRDVKNISGKTYNYSYTWNTTEADMGKRRLEVAATDFAGQVTIQAVNVYVRTEPVDPITINRGQRTIKVVATDVYGKKGEAVRTVQVGALKPLLEVLTPTAGATLPKANPISVTGTSSNAKSIRVQLLGASSGTEYSKVDLTTALSNWSASLSTGGVYFGGNYKIKVTAFDDQDQPVTIKEVAIKLN